MKEVWSGCPGMKQSLKLLVTPSTSGAAGRFLPELLSFSSLKVNILQLMQKSFTKL